MRSLPQVTQLGKGRASLTAHFGLLQTLGCVTAAVTEGVLGLRVYCQRLNTFNGFLTKGLQFHFAGASPFMRPVLMILTAPHCLLTATDSHPFIKLGRVHFPRQFNTI